MASAILPKREDTAYGSRLKAGTTAGCASAFSRHAVPEFLQIRSPQKREGAVRSQEGRREDRVRAAPAVSCAKVDKKSAHEHTGSAEAVRPSLRNGFTAYTVLSPARPGLLVTVAREKRELLANLTPAIGASGPHDFAVRFSHARQSQLWRPPLPAPTSVTMANAPSLGTGWQGISR